MGGGAKYSKLLITEWPLLGPEATRVASLEHSYHPGNHKVFRSPVSGIKNQMIEEKMLLMPYRELEAETNTYFSSISHIRMQVFVWP